MLNCRELVDFLDDYTSGRLSADMRTTFDEQLAECPDSRSFIETYRANAPLLEGGEDAPALMAGAPDHLVAAVMAARRHLEC